MSKNEIDFSDEAQEAMRKVVGEEPSQADFDTLYDILVKQFDEFYPSLKDGSPEKVYIDYFMRPAVDIMRDPEKEPILYATTLSDVTTMDDDVVIPKGTRVRIVMLSRFGDIGITTNLAATRGYETRVSLISLTDYQHTRWRTK